MSRLPWVLILALSTLLLSACQTSEKQTSQFVTELNRKVTTNFYDYDHYFGQQCVVTMEYSSRQQRYNVMRTQGDEALCLKAWQVIGTAKDLPPPPPNYIKGIVLNFKPGN